LLHNVPIKGISVTPISKDKHPLDFGAKSIASFKKSIVLTQEAFQHKTQAFQKRLFLCIEALKGR